jgi:hypothetical protein
MYASRSAKCGLDAPRNDDFSTGEIVDGRSSYVGLCLTRCVFECNKLPECPRARLFPRVLSMLISRRYISKARSVDGWRLATWRKWA